MSTPVDIQHTRAKWQTVISLCAWIVVLIPVWFYTTQVHRAALPVAEVRQLASSQKHLKFATRIHLTVNAEDGTAFNTGALVPKLKQQLDSLFDDNALGFSFEFDDGKGPTRNGVYSLTVSCGAKALKGEGSVVLSADRSVALRTNVACGDVESIERQIVTVIGGLFLPEKADFRAVQSGTIGNDANSMRKVKFSTDYHVMFNLLNADPTSLLVDWNIQEAIHEYIKPFTDHVSKLYTLNINSQTQYYTTLAINPSVLTISGKQTNILYPYHLPHFLNNAEWSFGGSSVSTSPPINFVLYVPTESQTPLRIADENGEFTNTNAFSIPQWGGVVIHNPDHKDARIAKRSNGANTLQLSVQDLEPSMSTFLAQLRGLLGVKEVTLAKAESLLPGFTFRYEGSPRDGITKWELDRLTRLTTLQNTVSAVSTLNSLVNMIESLENMVVLDHIRDEVAVSLGAVERVYETLDADEALAASKVAIGAAERAFFDPTMVSLLYFPDEHKLAVYLPLFLPVGVPLLQTIAAEVKKKIAQMKGRGKKEKTE